MTEQVNNVLFNSARWDALEFRDGDIIVATPAKCGTTWTQRVLSLLIFDSPDLYAPMSRISPWLDMNTRPLADVLAELEAQTHRRFIKSHLPFEYLPHDERVTYITVGRDPRDVALSMAHHVDNVDFVNLLNERIAAVGIEDLEGTEPPPRPDASGTPADRFWQWLDAEDDIRIEGLGSLVDHLRGYWEHRHDPNVVLLHYGDLERDLVGEMQYLAERLGLERSRERLEELAPYASFETMKAAAAQVAPNADQTFWKSTDAFFHKGKSGQWREFITDDDLPRYDKRVAELCDPDLAHWLHHGGRTVESK